MGSKKEALFLTGLAAIVAVGIILVSRKLPENTTYALGRESADQVARFDPPTITVECSYPGANAEVVRDTVAAPIEQQVNGVEGMVSMVSQCTNDGKYTLNVTFKPRSDLNIAQVLVQNRTSLALPTVPQAVQQIGIAIKKKSAVPTLIVTLFSPDNRYAALYLSNFAKIQVQPELARVEGLGEVVVLGMRNYSASVWLDPAKLAQLNVTVQEVAEAIKAQNIPAKDEIGKSPKKKVELEKKDLGRLTDLEDLGQIIVKAKLADKGPVRLKDLGEVKLGVDGDSSLTLDGKSASGIACYTLSGAGPGRVSAATLKKMTELAKHFPDGLDWKLAFDFTLNFLDPGKSSTPEYFQLDIELPNSASTERTQEVLAKCEKIVKANPDVERILGLTGSPLVYGSNRAKMLIQLAPAEKRKSKREDLVAALRKQFQKESADASIHLFDQSGPGRFPLSYPIEFGICDRAELGQKELIRIGEELVERLRKNPKFAEVALCPGAKPVGSIQIDVDRAKAKALGVSLDDIFNTIALYDRGIAVADFNKFGRSFAIRIKDDNRGADFKDRLKLKVRNNADQLVSLSTIVTVREEMTTPVLERFNLYPMVRVVGDTAAGVSLAEARQVCEKAASDVLPKGMELRWLRELPAK
jgi:multidrug efflux pump subunit AcrB